MGIDETLSREFLTRAEAAEYVRAPVTTLAAWAYRGLGPEFFRVGRRVLYKREDLDHWLEEQRVHPGVGR